MAAVQPLLKSLPKLPAPYLWPTLFKGSRARGHARVSVMTEELAESAAKVMDISNHPNRSIIEIYPGPGQLTRSMALAGAKKVVTLDNGEMFQKSLKALEENSKGRIQHFALNPLGEPYDDLLASELNALPGLTPQPWDTIQSDIMLVGSIPNSALGEKAFIDLLKASMERMGIFRMGRVGMYMFCSKEAVKRFTSPAGTTARNRLTLLAEAAAEVSSIMVPGASHFHLPYEYELLRIVPHEKPKLETSLDIMEFCLKSLFTSKSMPLSKVIKLLGPGAEILLGRLSFDHNIKVKYMTLEQVNEVASKFDQWPLRPTNLVDDLILHEKKDKRH
ncbi:S-adenosyl-L-methionine-dependent methyltransferase [Lobosporangium transversale]|uniref:rRNA adenine N(6)-methyltransferase n=1 Tax=Lobosporangium transversale TaxID=64571 RepID=A0A1Y2GJE3_9FUNG|nr:S-adenosyl-L-methionine-dependent methyltransferase [Lobosporangium transversale]ORZ12562.1 S-adenosyl-L-methionine-dependent methyltransferase [Lobosporangium transversale]|eukprot:XP_021880181.1 S-adenosyl-L-methionine-dependent methyltransferase [Lobosporangium transversale]